MHLTDTTTNVPRGPAILMPGSYGQPYYRGADFPDPLPVADLTPAQRGCLMREIAVWLREASDAAASLAEELRVAEEVVLG